MNRLDIFRLRWHKNVDGLLQALKYSNPQDEKAYRVRVWAAIALGKIGDRMAVLPLINTLENDSLKVSTSAVEALGMIGDLRAVRPLIVALENDSITDKDCQCKIIKALGRLGDKQAVEPLIDVLKSTGRALVVRSKAAEVLGEFGDLRATPYLIAALHRKPTYTSFDFTVMNALGNLGDPQALEVLLSFIDSSNASARWVAAQSVEKIYKTGKCDARHKRMIFANLSVYIDSVHSDTTSRHTDYGNTVREHSDHSDSLTPYHLKDFLSSKDFSYRKAVNYKRSGRRCIELGIFIGLCGCGVAILHYLITKGNLQTVWCIVVTAFLAFFCYLGYLRIDHLAKELELSGTITNGVIILRGPDFVVFEFGDNYRFEQSISSGDLDELQLGDQVMIRFMPENPNRCRIIAKG